MLSTPNAHSAKAAPAAQRKRGSLNKAVYDALRAQITSNRLRPGVKLTHEELANTLNVSRTPVREALERLLQEGLVTKLPLRGFFVAEIGEEEVRELFEMREALELYALRRTMAMGLKPADLARLDQFTVKYKKTLQLEDAMPERMAADREWHLTLAACANNQVLLRTLQSIFERLALKFRTDGFPVSRSEEALREHEEMMDALQRPNAAIAERLLADHIQSARQRIISHLKRRTDSPMTAITHEETP